MNKKEQIEATKEIADACGLVSMYTAVHLTWLMKAMGSCSPKLGKEHLMRALSIIMRSPIKCITKRKVLTIALKYGVIESYVTKGSPAEFII